METSIPPQNELDVHGLSREEALSYVHDFLTHAQETNVSAVRIITGRGEGILQKAVLVFALKNGYAITPEQGAPEQSPASFIISLAETPRR